MAAPATLSVFNILRASDGTALSGVPVRIVLNGDFITVTATGDAISDKQQSTTTDSGGRYAFTIVGNDLLSPANTTYTIFEPDRTYQIAPQSTNGASQQTTASNVIVNTPVALAPATSSITGNLTVAGTETVAGLLTAQSGLTVSSGTFTIPTGGFTMAGPLTLTANNSQVIPGSTNFSVRDNINANDNLLVSNAGIVTIRSDLALPNGNFALTTGNETITAGDLTLTAGELIFGDATSQIIPGATSLSLRNTANTNDNLLVSDAGAVTVRAGITITTGGIIVTAGGLTVNSGTNLLKNSLTITPSPAGTVPATSYGSVQVKLDEQTGTAVASLTVSIPSDALYRQVVIDIMGKSDQASAQNMFLQFNGDTAANYDYNFFTDTNASLAGGTPGVAGTSALCGAIPGTGSAANSIAQFRIVIANADKGMAFATPYHAVGNYWNSDAAAGAVLLVAQGKWRNTVSPLTSVKFILAAGNFANVRATVRGEP